jgi:endonuclease/exonuclease/phosphatase (EEP) superfamily protein YafD
MGPLNTARRTISIVAGVPLMTLACVAFAVRYAPLPNHLWLAVAVAAPFLVLAAPLALLFLLWGRRWMLIALAAGLTAAAVVVQVPLYVAATADGPSITVHVMTINMKYGRADAGAITALANDRADVLMIQELTPEAVRRLRAAGIGRNFRHHLVEPRPMGAGVGLYSRYPITTSARVGGLQWAMVSSRLRIEGVTTDLTVASVHLASPWPHQIDGWHHDLDSLPSILGDIAAEVHDGSIVIAGDFNATIDMRPFRRLLDGDYRDASEQAGAGRQFTFPSNRRIPPFMGIDHVLTRNATSVATETVSVPGSDHRALLATVLVPRDRHSSAGAFVSG